ncbi:MAG: transglutaminase [Candidatus Latescibacterota bacterium]|nr:MAG: transglutaminase [Candidatus Latescibacterota bacterium]
MTSVLRSKHVWAMLVILMPWFFAVSAFAQPGAVKETLPSPCKYPGGLTTDGERFFVADWREAVIYEIDPNGGAVLRSREAPTLKPKGLTYGDGLLYISDDHTGAVYAWNFDTGIVEHTFQAPGNRAAGLAWSDDGLYILEKKSKLIYKVLPEDGTILANLPVPDRSCECMAFDGNYLWISNRIADEIYMVEPVNGKVIGILDAPGPYTAGLAWAEGYLWDVDFQDRKIYQLVIDAESPYKLSDTRFAKVEYYWALNNYGPGRVTDVVLNIAVPEQLPNQELLSALNYSTTPAKHAVDQWNQPCAVFELGAVEPGSKAELTYTVDAKVSAIRYLIIPEKTGSLKDIPREIRKQYLGDGSRYRTESPYIKETVSRVVGDEKNPYWIARKIFDFIIGELHYEMIGGWDVPEVVLKRGSGSCSEYTFSFVSMCRAAGLPARYQGSVVVRGDDASIDEAFHRWAQIYLPNYGWVPVDANRGDSASPVGQAKGIGQLADRFLITTHSGGGSDYLAWSYNSFAKYKMDGYCKIEEDNLGFWEPLDAATAKKLSSAGGSGENCDQSVE